MQISICHLQYPKGLGGEFSISLFILQTNYLSRGNLAFLSRLKSPTENRSCFPRATLVAKRPPHTSATPFLASLRRLVLYQPHFGTNGSEQTGLPSWKVAWSYVENFSSYSRSKLIKFYQLFRGVFKRSSNRNTYRNEAFKDIFSCRGKSL